MDSPGKGQWLTHEEILTSPPSILHCKTAFVIKRFPIFKGRLTLAAWLLWI